MIRWHVRIHRGVRYHLAVLFISIAFSIPAEATDSGACEKLDSTKAILRCALDNHPAVREATLSKAQASEEIEIARLRPNPELNNQTILGGEDRGDRYAEFNFAHTFELGGKRAARIKGAEARLRLKEALERGAAEEIYLSTIVTLFRLRQLREELTTIDDALSTFRRLSKQYRLRPRLSPDQKASLTLFQIAEQDYRLRRAPLEAETTLRLEDLELAVGKVLSPRAEILPKRFTQWPKLHEPDSGSSSVKILEARAQVEKSNAEFSTAQSGGWPDLKIGPTITTQRRLGLSYEAYGLNFSLPLPIYHVNGPGKAAASRSVERSKLALEVADRERHHEEEYLKVKYESAVAALDATSAASELAKKHEEIEKMFANGFINGSVIVETHRQLFEFTKSQNEQELSAIEAYVRFNALSGKLAEVTE